MVIKKFLIIKLVEKARNELNGEKFLPKNSKTGISVPILVNKYESKMDKNRLPNRNLLVKNIDNNVSLKEINKLFSEFGEITSSKLEVDFDGNSKGYGYVSFANEEQAEKAISNLNEKEINGKKINVLLIPSKNKGTIYVKNFPRDFTEDDLKKFFSKFGEISSVSITKDFKGFSKGFGFVNFNNFQEANNAIKKTNEEHFTFPSCAPLYASFPIKKEEREILLNKNSNPNRHPKLFARKINVNSIVNLFIINLFIIKRLIKMRWKLKLECF